MSTEMQMAGVLAAMDHFIELAVSNSANLPDDIRASPYVAYVKAACAAVAELIAADHAYDKARREWDHLTMNDPQDFSHEEQIRIAADFEEATMRRIAALVRVGGAA